MLLAFCFLGIANGSSRPLQIAITTGLESTPGSFPPPTSVLAPSVDQVVIDGRLDDGAWASVEPAPPLLPFAGGHAAPDVVVRCALTSTGLALALEGIDGGFALLVDPDGLEQRWWRLDAVGDEMVWSSCGLEGTQMPVEASLPSEAGACRPRQGEVVVVTRARDVEALIPWDELPGATEHLRVALAVGAPPDGGTWSPGGSARLSPRAARPLVVEGRSNAALATLPGSGSEVWQGRLRVPTPPDDEWWTWTLWRRGTPLQSGRVRVPGGGPAPWTSVDFSLPSGSLANAVLLATAPGAPLQRAARTRLLTRRQAWIATPAFDDRIVVEWDSEADLPGAEIRVTTPSGALLGTATVDLPAGWGQLAIRAEDDWPEVVKIHLAGLLEDGLAVRASP